MPHPTRSRALLFLALLALAPARATTVYENHTFTTFAGLAESGGGWYDGTGTAARLYAPFGLGADTNGNVYVADTANHTIRKITPAGVVTTLAGLAGSSGSANGTGSSARFNNPACTAVDRAGNVYVADSGNATIRKISPAGVVTTLAGQAGYVGTNDGVGTAAHFYSPGGLVVGSNGVVFAADSGASTIRRISPAGAVTTFAGVAGYPGSADGTGTAAHFYYPQAITMDKNGYLYVADTYNHTVRKITPAGVVTTFAGSAGQSGTANATGNAARFNYPYGVGVDTNGNVYVGDTYNQTIRKITPGRVVTTVAGTAGSSGTADGTNSTARFYHPCGTTVDAGGNVYVTDTSNNTIRKLAPDGTVTTFAGLPATQAADDGIGASARFNYPSAVAVGPDSSVYVADNSNQTIRKASPAGEVTTLAGLAGTKGTNNGTGTAARFNSPTGVATDADGNVYVADTYNYMIRKITPLGEVTTIAGKAETAGTNDGVGSAARFYLPFGVAVDAHTNVYVADTWNHAIRKITPAGLVTTLAGSPGISGSANGTGRAAQFYLPEGLAVDTNGNVFVADSGNCTIRKITPAGVVTTFAGSTGVQDSADGTGSTAHFYFPFSLTLDSNGNLIVADTGNCLIRKVTPAGVTTTLGGVAGKAASADGTGSDARFYYPESVAVDGSGTIYVADSSSHAIRKAIVPLPDKPVVDPVFARPEVVRQFDVTNLTTTSWSWAFLRHPALSAAELSSTTARNPTLTPDVADKFIVRFQGTDAQGRAAIGTLTLDPDVTAPKVVITKPVAGQHWSNSVFTVMGTASDNRSVAAVWCQANASDWVLASGASNWNASVTLAPGTNVIRAYALDTAGNSSPTNSVKFIHIVTDRLLVQSTGQGTISPNYSNRVLEVGHSFTVTASPINGHKFANWVVSTNWTGGTVKTNPTLTFVMQSNLTLQVNFIDVTRPTVSITYPTASQRVTNINGQITLRGKASDNAQVGNAHYQLNGGSWTDAAASPTWSNWTASISPLPRTNVVKAYSVDVTGNNSVTNSVSFIFVVNSPITLVTNGIGAITHGFTGNLLEVGRTYTVTAVPGSGQVFSNWTGTIPTATSNPLTFVMQSNMVINANFIPNPFLRAKGTYNGLFAETVRVHERSGFFSLTLGDHGAYSASLVRGTNTYPFSGQFDVAGNASKSVNSWLVNMALDLAGAEQLTGTISGSNWVADLLANRSVFDATTNPATAYAGKYTLIIHGATNDPALPAGDGYSSLMSANSGQITLNGSLSDGNTLNQSVPISRHGDWPYYQSRYSGQGSVWGWLLFDTNNPSAEVNGWLSWIKRAAPGATFYPLGFTNLNWAEGARYKTPTNTTTRVIEVTNGVVIFDGGNLTTPFTNVVTLTPTNRVINGSANSMSLSLTLSNGTFSGSVKVPGTTRTNTFKGALLQDQDSGSGFFLGTNQSGRVFFGPQP